jgi:glycosyltransferase involved in cell wall biosynthesis
MESKKAKKNKRRNQNNNNEESKKIKICLNMIVKNEEKVIQRCIDSVPFVDAICISDTGSSDNTVGIIEGTIKNKNVIGGVQHDKWVDFGANRTTALRYAESMIKNTPGIWYILFMDADDFIIGEDGNPNNLTLIKFDKAIMDKSKRAYTIEIRYADTTYDRIWMIKYDPKSLWKWVKPLHEVIIPVTGEVTVAETGKITSGYIHVTREGARSDDCMKYMKDAVTIEGNIKQRSLKNSKTPIDPRELFYLAQSYRDSGIPHLLKNAEKMYLERIKLVGFDEEVYMSYVEAGRCRQRRGKNDLKTLEYYMKAFDMRPHRLEAPYSISLWFRQHNMIKVAYNFCRPLVNIPYPANDLLFVDNNIHRWRFLEEVAICAYSCGDKTTCRSLCERLLSENDITLHSDNKSRIEQMLKLTK